MREFTKTLRHLVRLSGKTERQIAEHGGLDLPYLRCLLDGTKCNPGADQLMRLVIGIIYDPALYEKRHQEGNEALQDVLAALADALQTDRFAEVPGTFLASRRRTQPPVRRG